MMDNAWRYGFVLSYPKDAQDLTCYAYESWHYRYVGRVLAQQIHDSGVTPREYLWRLAHA
jgi:D-alanyl-D-alanine carboxypeptidase